LLLLGKASIQKIIHPYPYFILSQHLDHSLEHHGRSRCLPFQFTATYWQIEVTVTSKTTKGVGTVKKYIIL